MLDEIRDFYAYNAWANNRILDRAERLDQDQFLAADDGGASIRDTLAHTLGAQWIWLQRWLGNSPRQLWAAEEFPDVASLRQRWDEVERESNEYLARLQEAGLAQPLSLCQFEGGTLGLSALAAVDASGQSRQPASERGGLAIDGAGAVTGGY